MTILCSRCRREVTAMRAPLTLRQFEIYDFIASFIEAHKIAPSCGEIARQFELRSLATVAEHLENLARKGWIIRAYNEERGIQLVEEPMAEARS